MIHILCFEPHLKVIVALENTKAKQILNSQVNYASAISLKLSGQGIDAAKILPNIRIPSILIGLINQENRQTIIDKINESQIELIEIKTNRGSKIDVEINANKDKHLFLSPEASNKFEEHELLNQIEKLNKYDVLIIPGETNYELMHQICKICDDNMVNFYFDYKSHFNPEILETAPFLVSFDIEQVAKFFNKRVDESNIFDCLENIGNWGAENIIVVNKNTIFLKFKSYEFSVFCEGFSEMNQFINKEMLIAAFIGFLASNPDPRKAINEAISIVRDFMFNISSNIIYKKSQEISDLFKTISFDEKHEETNSFMDLSVYWNTKELLFVISQDLIANNFTENAIEKKIAGFFKTNEIRTRTSLDNLYFHIKLFDNQTPINDLTRLEAIAKNNKEHFLQIIKTVLKN